MRGLCRVLVVVVAVQWPAGEAWGQIAPPTITTSLLPDGAAGIPYALQMQATGGIPPYIWDVVDSALPPGLTMTQGGLISGTPTEAGSWGVIIRVRDYSEQIASRKYSLTIKLGILTASPLPTGAVGVGYGVALTAFGGAPPYSWQLFGGTLPPGVELAPTGLLSGTPTEAGVFTFAVRVFDQEQQDGTKSFSVTINPPLQITTSSPLPNGFVGSSYTIALGATGGVPPYRWSQVGGTLPDGLMLESTGLISGVPTAAGAFSFTAQVTDQAQSMASRQYSLTVVGPLTIVTESLPDGTVGEAYSQQLAAEGGMPGYTWSISDLPPGLTGSPGGLISGTPTQAGNFTVTVLVMDTRGVTATRSFPLIVVEAIPPLEITTGSPLKEGQTETAYTVTFGATGGRPPYQWAVLEEGGLPPGLELSAGGVLSGTPSEPGTFEFRVRVRDSRDETAEGVFQLVIRRAPLTIVSEAILPQAEVGEAYSFTFEAAGGTRPYTQWTVILGSPPSGLTLSEAGELSGAPAVNGDFGFRVQVRDSAGESVWKDFAIRVTGMPRLPEVSLQGLPVQTDPTQPQTLRVNLAGPFAAALRGVATLTFTSEAVVPADDPAVQFATGGRTAEFTIPAGETNARFGSADNVGVQTGSVAGRIHVTLRIFAGEQEVTPSPQPAHEMQVRRMAPVIRSVRATRTANGLEVRVTGISSPREVTQATFQFTAAAGANLQTSQVTVNVGQAFGTWYQNPNSFPFGSAFEYVQPFTVSGSTADVAAVSVTLVNSQGSSSAVSANF